MSEDRVLEGAEPLSLEGGPSGALVLHGFTGSPHSVRGLGAAFGRAGFAVEAPRLPGHGTSLEDMRATTWSDWSGAVEDAYATLEARCERVVVAGLSMGGALSLWLASRRPSVAALALVNPLVDVASLAPARDEAMDAIAVGKPFLSGVGGDIAKPGVVEVAYDGRPATCVISALDAVAELTTHLSEIRVPALLVHSRHDHVVPRASRELLEARYGGPLEVMELERSFHVATLDYDAEEIERRAVGFSIAVLAASVPPPTSER